MIKSLLIFFFLLLGLCSSLQAQQNYLDRSVTIKAGTYTYQSLFKIISAQTSVVFSHSKFNDLEKRTVQFIKKPLYFVLDELFKNTTYTYKIKGKYIIIHSKTNAKTSEVVALNGYVFNAEDSTALKEVSIYIKQNKLLTTSNESGYFTLTFPAKSEQIVLSFAKENYSDTSVLVQVKSKDRIQVYLRDQTIRITARQIETVPDSLLASEVKDSVPQVAVQEDSIKPQAFWERFKDVNFRNINDTLFNNVAFSLFPPISTNRLLSINTVNRLSFNVFSGYSKGIDLLEIGGMFNMDHGDVQFVQLAGLSNVVSGKVRGVQMAGLLNYNGNRTTAVQCAGLFNINRYHSEWAQFAGIGNIIDGRYSGVQAAGVWNMNRAYSEGAQFAGVFNISPGYKGAQFAGIANVCWKNVYGAQFAGIVNTADTVHGAQVSGILNLAKCNKGLQLGFINLSDCNEGIPIGFLSFVRTGYHKLEFAYDDQRFMSLSFRTGVDRLHNIVGFGINANRNFYQATYGLGTALSLTKKKQFLLGIDLSTGYLQGFNQAQISYNALQKCYLGLEFRPLKKVNLAIGVTANLLMSDVATENFQPLSNKLLLDEVNGSLRYRAWLGWKVALRFL